MHYLHWYSNVMRHATACISITVGSPAIHEADRLQPIQIEYFGEHVKNMHENRDKRFEREYQVTIYVSMLEHKHAHRYVCACACKHIKQTYCALQLHVHVHVYICISYHYLYMYLCTTS